MKDIKREYRIKAMMHRFFSLYEKNNCDFSLVKELLCEKDFVWNSPSGNLIGIEAFEHSFNELNKEWRHSHAPEEMLIEFVDEKKAKLSFNYTYQNLQGETLALHAKGHYEILCIDEGTELPKIQKCDLTLIKNIENGTFKDLYEKNNKAYLELIDKVNS